MQDGSSTQPAERKAILGHLLLFMFAVLALWFLSINASTLNAHAGYFERRNVNFQSLLLAFCYLAIIVTCAAPATNRKGSCFALGFSVALTIMLFLALPLLLFGAMWSGYSIGPWVLLSLSNLGLWIGAALAARGRGGRAVFIVLGIATAPGTVLATVAFANYEQSKFRELNAHAQHAPKLIYGVEKCLVAYSLKPGKGSYPAELSQLQSALAGCADRNLTEGKYVEGYKLTYALDPASGGKRFSLLALPSVTVGKYMTSFFSDETGLLHKQTEGTIAGPGDPLVSTTELVLATLNCARNYSVGLERQRAKGQRLDRDFNANELNYPASFNDLADLCFGNSAFSSVQARVSSETNSLSDATYTVTYRPPPAGGKDFVILARPLLYGETGIRSYFVDNSGVLKTTLEDREATREDPSLQFHEVSGECCPYQTGFLPVAKFKLESKPDGDQYFGGLPDGEKPRLLWHTSSSRAPGLRRVDPAGNRLYVTREHMVLGVYTLDLKPLWAFTGGSSTTVVEDGAYITIDSLLTKFTLAGQQMWSFDGLGSHMMVAADGTIFGLGNYLYSIRPDGQELWRMQLRGTDRPCTMLLLSSDSKVLYVLGSAYLYAIDARAGQILWKAEYGADCYWALGHTVPLEDGTVVVEHVTPVPGDYRNKLLALRDGRRLWERPFSHRLWRLSMIYGMNTVLVEEEGKHSVQALGPDGNTIWEIPAEYASKSKNKGLFYACQEGQLKLFDSHGASIATIGNVCDDVREGPNNLLIISGYWSTVTIKLPKSPAEMAEDARKTTSSVRPPR